MRAPCWAPDRHCLLAPVGHTRCRFCYCYHPPYSDHTGTEGEPTATLTASARAGLLTQSELVTSLYTSVHDPGSDPDCLLVCWLSTLCSVSHIRPFPLLCGFFLLLCSFLGTQDGTLGTCPQSRPLFPSRQTGSLLHRCAGNQGCLRGPSRPPGWTRRPLCPPPADTPVLAHGCLWSLPLEEEAVDTFSGGERKMSCGRKRVRERIRKLSFPGNLDKRLMERGSQDHLLTWDGPEAPQPQPPLPSQLWSCWAARWPQACICVRIGLPAPGLIA